MKHLIQLVAFIVWVAGIVIANGFWSTFFAVVFPFWGWYLVVERLLITNGLI